VYDLAPYRPSPLELLAADAGLDYWTLRDYLEAEIERRQSTNAGAVERAPLDERHVVADTDQRPAVPG
jgi:hypothetical protein